MKIPKTIRLNKSEEIELSEREQQIYEQAHSAGFNKGRMIASLMWLIGFVIFLVVIWHYIDKNYLIV